MLAHRHLHHVLSLLSQGPAVLPGLVVVFNVLSPVSPAVPIFYQRMADGIREAHGRAVGSRVGHLSDSGAELVEPRSVVIALFQVSREP